MRSTAWTATVTACCPPPELPGGRGAPLTRAAHRAQLAERFRRQDTNRDGVLDARELAAPPR